MAVDRRGQGTGAADEEDVSMTGFKHIVEFIESKHFKGQLVEACKNFEILSEADLQVFVCRKLFELFAVTPTLTFKYRANAEPFCRELKFYPDIAIFRRRSRATDQPAIAIELKEGHSFGAAIQHDCKKLREYRNSIRVRRAYLIHVVHAGAASDFQRILASEKKGLKNVIGIPVVVQEQLGRDEYKSWHRQRRKLVEAFAPSPKLKSKAHGAGA